MTRPAAAAVVALVLAGCQPEEEFGPTMKPGSKCISCHDGSGKAPWFTAAGTVYRRGDAAENEGVAGARVDLRGLGSVQTVALTTNSAGNFYTNAELTLPIIVRVALGENTAVMQGGAAGECAGCHGPPPNADTPPIHPLRVHVGTCADCHP